MEQDYYFYGCYDEIVKILLRSIRSKQMNAYIISDIQEFINNIKGSVIFDKDVLRVNVDKEITLCEQWDRSYFLTLISGAIAGCIASVPIAMSSNIKSAHFGFNFYVGCFILFAFFVAIYEGLARSFSRRLNKLFIIKAAINTLK